MPGKRATGPPCAPRVRLRPPYEPRPAGAWGGFTAEARKLKKRLRLDRILTREAQRTPPDRVAGSDGPARPMPLDKARLWAWYRATGKSWAQFIHDHGEP